MLLSIDGRTRKFIIKEDALGYYFADVIVTSTGLYSQPDMDKSYSLICEKCRPNVTNKTPSNCPTMTWNSSGKFTVFDKMYGEQNVSYAVDVCPMYLQDNASGTVSVQWVTGPLYKNTMYIYDGTPTSAASKKAPWVRMPSNCGYQSQRTYDMNPMQEAYYLIWTSGSFIIDGAKNTTGLNTSSHPYDAGSSVEDQYTSRLIDLGISSGSEKLQLLHLSMDYSASTSGSQNLTTTVPLIYVRFVNNTSTSYKTGTIRFASWCYEMGEVNRTYEW